MRRTTTTILAACAAAVLFSPSPAVSQAVNLSAGNEAFQISLSTVPTWGWGAEMPVVVVPPPHHRHHRHDNPPVVFHAPMIPGYVEEVVEYVPAVYRQVRRPGRATKAGVSLNIGGIPVGLIYEKYDDDDYDDDDYYDPGYYAPAPRRHKVVRHSPPPPKHHRYKYKDKHDKHYYKHHYKHHKKRPRHHDDDD